jgi:hypothetical protein
MMKDPHVVASFDDMLKVRPVVCRTFGVYDSFEGSPSSIGLAVSDSGSFLAVPGTRSPARSRSLHILLSEVVKHILSPSSIAHFPLTAHVSGELQSTVDLRNIEDAWPLAPMQEGMLFEWLKDGGGTKNGSTMFLRQDSVLIRGRATIEASSSTTDISQLTRMCWQILSNTWESLRSLVLWDGPGEPLQVVLRVAPLRFSRAILNIVDWRCLITQGLEKFVEVHLLKDCLAEDQKGQLGVEEPPFCIRVVECRSLSTCVVVTKTWHHILLDGWSLGLLAEEEKRIFASLEDRRGANFLPCSRRGYPSLHGFYEWIGEQSVSAAKVAWTTAMRGFQPVEYPWENSTGVLETLPVVVLSREIVVNLALLSRSVDVTLATTLQNLFGILLMCVSGARDVVYGTVVTGRQGASSRVECIEGMVGNLMNMLPRRVRWSGTAAFGRTPSNDPSSVYDWVSVRDTFGDHIPQILFNILHGTWQGGQKSENS